MRAIATRLLQSCRLAAAFAAGTAAAVTFNGANNGPIPHNDPAGRTMTFIVSNLEGRLRTVPVTIELNHSFVGDLDMRLVSPSGLVRLALPSRAGASRESETPQVIAASRVN
jgi:subtilisin-like proprotein convertase family protein